MQNSRLVVVKGVLWGLLGVGLTVGIVRFTLGLGVATALSDTTPWGLWIGFDVMAGVALAAGGFVVAAIVHVFHRERYREAARPAILTAFLGYAAVVVGLLVDLGLPWHIWRPIVSWNIRSPLFEVAWCVMLYLAVLALELAPVILERTPFRRAYLALRRLQLPLIVLGIMLSTLHQSSLGSLLLIMPLRVPPLWYTPALPELFFVSAIALGLCMVTFESAFTSWVYRREPERALLSGLAGMARWALAASLVFRVGDLAFRGSLGLILTSGWLGAIFVAEMLLSTLIPLALFAIPRARRSPRLVAAGAASAVFGFIFNRVNASGLSQVWTTGDLYLPSWMEFAVSLGVVSAAALAFLFIQEHFPVNPHALAELEAGRERERRSAPPLAPLTKSWLGEGWRGAARGYSLVFVLAAAAALALVPKEPPTAGLPVERARGGDVLRVGVGPEYVYFDHRAHQDREGKAASCGRCHHLHTVGDIGTPCQECHRSLYTPTSIFAHASHVADLGGNGSCGRCHHGPAGTFAVSARCVDCHRQEWRMLATGVRDDGFESEHAPSYMDAMHRGCVPCHREKARDPAVARPTLDRCGTCHDEDTESERRYRLAVGEPARRPAPAAGVRKVEGRHAAEAPRGTS